MSLLSCQIEIPEQQGLKTNEVTVGRIFHLNCEGSWAGVDLSNAQAVLAPEQQYQLKILQAKVESETKAVLTVTSYAPGDHQILNWKLSVGKDQLIEMPPVAFQVTSVIKDPQNAKPFPAIGPLATTMPSELQMAAIGLVVACIFVLITAIFRIHVKTRHKKKLKSLEKNTSPFLELMSHLRSLKKDVQMRLYQNEQSPASDKVYFEMLEILRVGWFTYLSREWQQYMVNLSAKKVLRKMKGSVAREDFETWGEDLAQVLLELERLKKNKVLLWQDILSLSDRSQEVAETLEAGRASLRKKVRLS